MSENKKHIHYTAADIEKYHQGRMSPAEMNALEKAALDDPFLADALEGYDIVRVNVAADLAELEGRLEQRIKEDRSGIVALPSRKPRFYWWKLAAMIILVAGAGTLIYLLAFNNKPTDLAQAVKKSTDNTTDTVVTQKETGKDSLPVIVNAEIQADKKESINSTSKNETRIRKSIAEDKGVTAKKDEIELPVASAPADETTGKTAAAAPDPNDPNKEIEYHIPAGRKITPPVASAEAVNAARNRFARPVDNNNNKPGLNNAYIFRGRVTDRNNNALPFSNIMNTSDSIGTYADVNGYFNLVSTDSVLNVKISSVGFEPKIVSLQKDAQAHLVRLANDSLGVSHILISNQKANSRHNTDNMVLGEAEPAVGWGNYDLYIANNLQAPDYFKERKSDGMQGEVVLSFEVTATGEPVNITVKKSLCEACDREAIRLLKEGPKWKRKTRKGKATVIIRF